MTLINFVRFENEQPANRGRPYSCDHIMEHEGDLYRVTVVSHMGAHDVAEATRMLATYLAGISADAPLAMRVRKI